MNRQDKGKAVLTDYFGQTPGQETRPAFKDFSQITSDYLFGELWSREGLSIRDRSLITVAVLCGTGKELQLATHLKGALNIGLSPDQLKEVMMHIAHYTGWPCGMNGLAVLQKVVDDKGLSFSE